MSENESQQNESQNETAHRKKVKLLLLSTVLTIFYLFAVPPIVILFQHPYSHQEIYDAMLPREILNSAGNRNILVFIHQTDEIRTHFEWDEGMRVLVFTRGMFTNRYAIAYHGIHRSSLVPFSMSFDAGITNYTIDIGGSPYLRYADIEITAAGRSRMFYVLSICVVLTTIYQIASRVHILKGRKPIKDEND